MDKPIKRDSFEVVEEAGYNAIKGAATGAVLSFLAGAVATAIVAVTAGAIAGGIFMEGGFIAGAASMLAGTGGGLTALASVLVGSATAIYGGGVAMLGGGLFGLAKGASKASRENTAYNAKVNEKLMGKQADLSTVHNESMQLGYQTAMQQIAPRVEAMMQQAHNAGKQEVLNELQQHAAKAGSHDHDHHHNHHSHAENKQVSHAKAEEARRAASVAAAAAGAGAAIGG